MNVLIVYATKYGNTEKVAKLIAEGITSVGSNEVIVKNVKDVKLKEAASYELILFGSPVHFGRHVGAMKKFINKIPNSQLKVNAYAVFDTYILTDFEKGVKSIEQQVKEVMPDLTKASPGLSIKVEGTGMSKGPISSEDLPKCKEYGIKLVK